MFKLKAL